MWLSICLAKDGLYIETRPKSPIFHFTHPWHSAIQSASDWMERGFQFSSSRSGTLTVSIQESARKSAQYGRPHKDEITCDICPQHWLSKQSGCNTDIRNSKMRFCRRCRPKNQVDTMVNWPLKTPGYMGMITLLSEIYTGICNISQYHTFRLHQ